MVGRPLIGNMGLPTMVSDHGRETVGRKPRSPDHGRETRSPDQKAYMGGSGGHQGIFMLKLYIAPIYFCNFFM